MTYTRAKQPGSFHPRDALRPHGGEHARAPISSAPARRRSCPAGLHAFIKTRPELAVPDIEFMFRGTVAPSASVVSAGAAAVPRRLRHPSDAAASRQPRPTSCCARPTRSDAPRILYNFFTAPNDLPTLREGFKLAREVAYQQALDTYRGRSAQSQGRPDDATPRSMRGCAKPSSPRIIRAGTCAMGGDAATRVLDPQMRVRGGRGVCAWSTPPRCPTWCRRTSMPACMMMAEKASDIIRGRTPLPAAHVEAA